MADDLVTGVLIGDISLLTATFFAREVQPGPAPQANMTATLSVADVQLVDDLICVGTDLGVKVSLVQEGSEQPCFESELRVGCTAAMSAQASQGVSGSWGVERVLARHAAEASVGFARAYVCNQCQSSSLHQQLLLPPVDVDALLADGGAFSS